MLEHQSHNSGVSRDEWKTRDEMRSVEIHSFLFFGFLTLKTKVCIRVSEGRGVC